METSIRSVPFTLTRDAGTTSDGLTLAGYAAVFDSPTRINERGMTFDEVVAKGAFARAIAARDKVRLMYDHGQHAVLGTMPIGAIHDMREDDHGLYVEARLADNWMTKPLRDAIGVGAIDGMSFQFSVPDGGDTWDRSGAVPLRTLRQVKLYELGPVVWPAYSTTEVAVRSALELLDDDQAAAVAHDLEVRRRGTGRSLKARQAILRAKGVA